MNALFDEKELPKSTAKNNKKQRKTPFLRGETLIFNGKKGRFLEEKKGTFIILNEAGKIEAINPKIVTGAVTGETWAEPVEIVKPYKSKEFKEC